MPDKKISLVSEKSLFSFTGDGIASGKPVQVVVRLAQPGSGINFAVASQNSPKATSEATVTIPANARFVVNTLRNVVLGKDGVRLCFVEHLLAAAALWGADDLLVEVEGSELPLGDGSANLWVNLFAESGLPCKTPEPGYELKEPLIVSKGDRKVIALPSEQFSITYLIDWQHPAIGKRWACWRRQDPITDISKARTFGSQAEQEILGLKDHFVNFTADGFSKPLHYEDEPVRHKLVDLLGDLTLCGINPLAIKAQFISIKAGHELDVDMARLLMNSLSKVEG